MSLPPSSRSGSKPPGGWEAPTLEAMQVLLPQYQFLSLLGRGGMGAVYKACQVSLDRMVAIKVLPGDLLDDTDVNFVQRFKQEARTMARMNHPAIVSVYDFGQTQDGLLYFVMEFVDGTDVSQMILAQRRLPSDHALAITAHVCDALAYAHGHGVVHRDIKPANVLINMEGQVKVADFGLAKGNDAKDHGLTKTHMAMGTPDFVAPEALIAGMSLDGRADLYAVGVMLYQMLTGEIPRGLWQMPSLRVGTDARFDAIIARAMQTDREMRYQSSQEIRQDLDRIVTMPIVQAGGQASVAIPKHTVTAQKPVAKVPHAPQPRKEAPPTSAPLPKKKSKSGLLMALGFSVATCFAVGLLVINSSPKPEADPAPPPGPEPKMAAAKPKGPKPPPKTVASHPPPDKQPPKNPPPKEPQHAFTAPAPNFNDRAQDVLPRVDLQQDTVVGEWRRQGDELILGKRVAAKNARVELPVLCGGSYLIETEFTVGTEVGDFALHLPFAAKPGTPRNDVTLRMILGSAPTAPVGFEYFSGKAVQSAQSPAAVKIESPKSGRSHLLARVQLKDDWRIALALWLEGKPLLEWEGKRSDLSGAANAWRPTHEPRFAIGTNSLNAIIHRVRIQPLDGNLEWLREVPPAVAATPPAPPPPSSSPAPAPAPDPVSIRLKEIEKQFQDAYDRQVGVVHKSAVADLNKKYVSALDRAVATASKSSKLDEALALRQEKDLVQSQGIVPAEDVEGTPASLKSVRETYRKTLGALTASRDKLAAPLNAAYDKALANYQDELTRTQKLDEAQRVKAVRDHLATQRDPGSAAAPPPPPPSAATPSASSAKPAPTAPPLSADRVLPPVTHASVDEVRELVKWCLEVQKGYVYLIDNGARLTVNDKNPEKLPKGKLTVTTFFVNDLTMDEEGKKRLSVLGRMPDLESISFGRNPGTLPVELLRGLTKLKYLLLNPTAVDDAAFAHLTGLKSLEKLSLAGSCKQFTGTGLGYINENLLELNTDSKTLSAEGMAYLSRFKKMKRLTLPNCTSLTDSMLTGLAGMPALEELDLSKTKLDGSFLAHLPANSNLKRLILQGAKDFKAENLPLLLRLKNLEYLGLPALKISPPELAPLGALPKLTALEMDEGPFTGEEFVGVETFGRLAELNLARCPITDAGWQAIAAALPGLQRLSFGRYTGMNVPCSPEAAGAHLSKLRNLTELTLTYTGIDDAWLPCVAQLKNLTSISLSGSAITDAAVPVLKSLPKLQHASTTTTQISEQARAEIARNLKN